MDKQGHETMPTVKVVTLVIGWRASAMKGEKAGHFRKVTGMSIVVAGSPRSAFCDKHFNSKQPNGLNNLISIF